MIEASRAIHGLLHWGRQFNSVDSLVAKNLIAEIVREYELVGKNRES